MLGIKMVAGELSGNNYKMVEHLHYYYYNHNKKYSVVAVEE